MPLDVLKEVKRSPRCVIIYRHPREVADSLALRDGFSAEKSALLWADHNLAAERDSRNLPRIFLDYRTLLQDPAGCLTDVSEKLDISWPVPPPRVEEALSEFLSAGLQHHRTRKNAKAFVLGRMSNAARVLYAALEKANRQDGAAQRSEFEQARRSFEEVYDTFDPLLMEQASQSSPTLAEITELRGTLVDRTRWLRLQAGEIERQQQSLTSLRDDLDSIREIVDWQGDGLVSLRDDLDSIREIVDWQGDGLVSLRSDLDAVKATVAEQERRGALGEMIWESKPWRLYLWLGRARRTVARRLRLL
ncbi:MAG: hypothetical protein IH936_10765 [Acidobacteria bacterium]|nr:hypothetical protein [Acidobacteriota bacterium]